MQAVIISKEKTFNGVYAMCDCGHCILGFFGGTRHNEETPTFYLSCYTNADKVVEDSARDFYFNDPVDVHSFRKALTEAFVHTYQRQQEGGITQSEKLFGTFVDNQLSEEYKQKGYRSELRIFGDDFGVTIRKILLKSGDELSQTTWEVVLTPEIAMSFESAVSVHFTRTR